MWVLQCLYANQVGAVQDGAGITRTFNIQASVPQGCMLSPRLFCAVLPWAMADWTAHAGVAGLDFNNGLPRLLDLRFADDIPTFGKTAVEATRLLDELVRIYVYV